MEPRPPREILLDRIDSILGELFERDTTEDSILKEGWEWYVGESDFAKVPTLYLQIDRIKEPPIRERINRILNRMNLRRSS